MNPILRKSSTLGKIILKPLDLSLGGTKFIPCGPRCVCLMYLDLSELRSQRYYENCFREKKKEYLKIYIFIKYINDRLRTL